MPAMFANATMKSQERRKCKSSCVFLMFMTNKKVPKG